MSGKRGTGADSGFTLIELLVVVMIVGILAALAVPQYYRTTEKNRASEAVNLFLSLKGSQDRYSAKYGGFCSGACPALDVPIPTLHYFTMGAFAFGGTGDSQSWKLTLTRNGAPAVYGAYQLTYDVEPGAAPSLTCNPAAPCTTDLLPHP